MPAEHLPNLHIRDLVPISGQQPVIFDKMAHRRLPVFFFIQIEQPVEQILRIVLRTIAEIKGAVDIILIQAKQPQQTLLHKFQHIGLRQRIPYPAAQQMLPQFLFLPFQPVKLALIQAQLVQVFPQNAVHVLTHPLYHLIQRIDLRPRQLTGCPCYLIHIRPPP